MAQQKYRTEFAPTTTFLGRVQQHYVELSIEYRTHFYYLSVMKIKTDGQMVSCNIDFRCRIIYLKQVQRASKKVFDALCEWLEQNYKQIANAYLYLTDDNMHAVYHYVLDHLPEICSAEGINAMNVNARAKFPPAVNNTDPDYYPHIGSWTLFGLCGTDKELILDSYRSQFENYKGNIRDFAEFYVIINMRAWFFANKYEETNGSELKEKYSAASELYSDLYYKARDWYYNNCGSLFSEEDRTFFFNFTD